MWELENGGRSKMDLNAKLTPYRLWYCLQYTFLYSILWDAVLERM